MQYYYSILGVDQTSNLEEITVAYRKRIKIVHPDRFNPETNPDEWQQANQMLQELNDAYNYIKSHLQEKSSSNTYEQEKRTEPSQGKESESSSDDRQEKFYPQKGVTTCLIKHLSLTQIEFIKSLKNNSFDDVFYIKTCYVIWRYLGFLIAGLIYIMNIRDWANLTHVVVENFWLGILWLFVLGFIMAKCLLTIYSYHRAKIKPCLIFTSMYCIEIFRNKMTFFHTWEIDSCTYHRKKIRTYFKIKVGDFSKRMRLPRNFEFQNYIKFKGKFSVFERFWNVISDPVDWLTANDILRDIKSKSIGRISIAALNFYTFFLIVTIIMCIGLFDSFTLVDKDFFARQKLKEHALRESFGGSLGNKKIPDVPNVFNQPLQPLPLTGEEFIYTNDEGVAPLSIKVPSLGDHYYVKVVTAYNGQNIKSVFIRSGGKVKIKVPLGVYKVKYAMGTNWYGRKYLFGPETQVAVCDDNFAFKVESDRVMGYTLELIKQQGGNLQTSSISLDDF